MLQFGYLALEIKDRAPSLFHRRGKAFAFALPAPKSFLFGILTTLLDFDLLADLTLGGKTVRAVDQLHAACFTSSVFASAVLDKVSPLKVTTDKDLLFVETHVSSRC